MVRRHPVPSTLHRILCTAVAAAITTTAPLAFAGEEDAVPAAPTGETAAAEGAAKPAPAAEADAKPQHDTKSHAKHGKKGKRARGEKGALAGHAAKPHGKTATRSSKAEATDEVSGKPAKSSKTKKAASRGKKKSSKKSGAAPTRGADAKAPSRRRGGGCEAPAVTFDRGGLEPATFALVDCDGKPLASARRQLSILGRPWGTSRGEGARRAASSLDLLDPGLLSRLAAVSKRFPGATLSIVAGSRPESPTSLHHSGRAVDLRVVGVDNAELAAFCRTLPDTGCGHYPNSSFVHLDVRPRGSGTMSWIDVSGPDEPPRYVREWPPKRGVVPPAP